MKNDFSKNTVCLNCFWQLQKQIYKDKSKLKKNTTWRALLHVQIKAQWDLMGDPHNRASFPCPPCCCLLPCVRAPAVTLALLWPPSSHAAMVVVAAVLAKAGAAATTTACLSGSWSQSGLHALEALLEGKWKWMDRGEGQRWQGVVARNRVERE